VAIVEPLGLYDPFVHTVLDDPYPAYRVLRDEFPVYHNEHRGCWVVSRYDDVRAVSRDVPTFSNAWGVDFDLPPGYLGAGSFLDIDPPDHTRLRRVLHEHLSPRRIESLESTIRHRARALIEGVVEAGRADLAAEVAFPLPMVTILGLVGFPEADGTQLREWLDATALRTPGTADRPAACDEAHDALAEYVTRLVEDRRRRPRGDLLSVMAEAVDARTMTVDETRGMSLLLLTAGWETTAALISSCFLHLARNEDQRRVLIDDPDAVAPAIEESLRFDAPVQYLMRTTTREATIHGVTIPAQEKVLLLYAAANRDDRVWEDADRFDVTRSPHRNLAFGDGIHHCIGAPLARLEARVAIGELLAVAPDYELDGQFERIEAHVLRGIHHLPIRT
jgi:cytochrome P450